MSQSDLPGRMTGPAPADGDASGIRRVLTQFMAAGLIGTVVVLIVTAIGTWATESRVGVAGVISGAWMMAGIMAITAAYRKGLADGRNEGT